MSEQNDIETAIAKLNDLLDAEDVTLFTNDEAQALKEVANIWRSAQGFVQIAKLGGATLKWFVVLGVSWAAFKTGLFGFIKNGMQ